MFSRPYDVSINAGAEERGSQRHAKRDLRCLFGLRKRIRVQLGRDADRPSGSRPRAGNGSTAGLALNVYGVILPSTTARLAPVAEGRFEGRRRRVSCAKTANAI